MATNFDTGDRATQIIKRYEQLRDERRNHDSWYEDLAFYCIPRKRNVVTQRTEGEELPNDLYDSTGVESLNIFAAGLQGFLTNPSAPWFELLIPQRELMEMSQVRIWLTEVRSITMEHLALSNFYQQMIEFYKDGGCFGTATLYEEEDPQTVIRFYTRHIKETYFCEDDRGRVNKMYRPFQYTALQAWERWGENSPDAVMKDMDAKKFSTKHDFLHVVVPRDSRDPGKVDKINKAFASIWLSVKDKKVIEEGGYDEFPFFVTRFDKNDGEPYGFSVAMNVLAEMRMANEIKKTLIRGAQKMVDPPLVLPHEHFITPLDFNCGAINYQTMQIQGGEKIYPIQSGGNIPIGLDILQNEQDIIRRAFFVDMFLALTNVTKRMTTVEVAERVQEKMLILGPILGRLMSEALTPIIDRTIAILFRRGLLPEPPAILQGLTITPRYISPLARAQQQAQLNDITSGIYDIASLAQLNPEVIDIVDFDDTARNILDIRGFSPKNVRDAREVAQLRDQREKMRAAQQGINAMQQGAEIYKTAAMGDKAAASAEKE